MRSSRDGQLLIVTLWMLGLVTMAAGAVVLRAGHEARLGRIPLESLQREAVADAAVQQAIALIQRDAEVGVDHLGESWATGEEDGRPVLRDISVGDSGIFTAELTDEARKISLNTADAAVLQRLIESVAEGHVNAQQMAEAIVDWRTASDPEGPACANQQPPCHNGPMATVDELRLVPGMTPELFDALAPYVTVYGNGVVNINTAPAKVLNALRCDGPALVTQREAAVPPILNPSVCDGTVATSTTFTVLVEAWLPTSSLRTRLQAVIDRDGNILSWLPQ